MRPPGSTRENVRLTFDHKVEAVIQEIVDTNFELYKRITDDRSFGETLKNFLFDQYLRGHRNAAELIKRGESKTLASQMIWSGDAFGGAILIFVCSFAVIYFTVRYGLRRFVFADLFQCPLMAIASLSLLIATLVVVGARVYEYTNDQTLISALFAQFFDPKVT